MIACDFDRFSCDNWRRNGSKCFIELIENQEGLFQRKWDVGIATVFSETKTVKKTHVYKNHKKEKIDKTKKEMIYLSLSYSS